MQVELVYPLVVLLEHVRAHLEAFHALTKLHLQAAHDVAHLAFAEEYDAGADHDVRVRAVEHVEIWEAWHGDALVGPWVAIPVLVQVSTVAAGDLECGEKLLCVKTHTSMKSFETRRPLGQNPLLENATLRNGNSSLCFNPDLFLNRVEV